MLKPVIPVAYRNYLDHHLLFSVNPLNGNLIKQLPFQNLPVTTFINTKKSETTVLIRETSGKQANRGLNKSTQF